MGLGRSFILTSLLICFSVIQGQGGIEIQFAQDDMSISSYYDVDDSVAVEEEVSASYGTGITDSRKVSGKGQIYAYQTLQSGNLWASLGAYGTDGHSVKGEAVMTPTALDVWQSAKVGGQNAYAYIGGDQNYLDGAGYTWQDAGVEDGWLSSTQGLILGSSILSGQDTESHGFRPYALGFAGIESPGMGFNEQIALISIGTEGEGSISGSLASEVVRTPQYEDPVVSGSGIEVSSDGAAGIVAGAGTIEGIYSGNTVYLGNPFDINPAAFLALVDPSKDFHIHGAATGAVGVGDDTKASAGYIEAGTDGHESYAYGVDMSAKGNNLAAVAAAAGNIEKHSWKTESEAGLHLSVDGALAGTAGVGKKSKVSAGYIEAGTGHQDWGTYALGENLRAKGKVFAAVAAGAGHVSINGFADPEYLYEGLNVEGAIAGAVGHGEKSKASAEYLQAATDYSDQDWDQATYAYGERLKAKGNYFAAVAAGAGHLYADREFYPGEIYEGLGINGALAGAAGVGEGSKASAKYLEAATGYRDWDRETYAYGEKLDARGDDLAAVAAGAGHLGANRGVSPEGEYERLWIEGALVGAAGIGEGSEASAKYLKAGIDYWDTFALARKLNAKGSKFAAAAAGAASLDMDSGSDFLGDYFGSMGADGALVGAVGAGDGSKVSAEFLKARIDDWYGETHVYGRKLKAGGDDFAAVAAVAGDLDLGKNPDRGYLDASAAIAGAAGVGDDSEASAKYLEAGIDYWVGRETYAYGRKLKAEGDNLAALLAASGDLHLSTPSSIWGKGAIAGALARGENSKVSARVVDAFTINGISKAKVRNLKAVGNDGVLAGSLAICGPVEGSPPISIATTYVLMDTGTLKNADFKAKVDVSGAPVLTASGETDLKDATGWAFAWTLNPSGLMSDLIDPTKIAASMNAVAEQGQPSITSVIVT